MMIRFEKLSSRNDYDDVIDLIFESDKIIYKDLFGSFSNAIRIMPLLFEMDTGIFSHNHIYLAKENNVVVGMLCYYKNKIGWDPRLIQDVFIKENIDIPESFDSVSKYFDKVLNYPRIGDAACTITVKPIFRRQGYGEKIMNYVIEIAKGEDISLDVLVENTIAISFYKKMGFVIIGEAYDDYGGFNKEPVKCYKMFFSNE